MAQPSGEQAVPPLTTGSGERLESWKEIAAYLKRDIRTVQRWEKSEGLPVHRHMHGERGTAYAYRQEIDAWWNSRPARLEEQAGNGAVRVTWRKRPLLVPAALASVVLVVGALYVEWPRIRWHARPHAERVTLVVLPFQNMTGDPQQEYLTDGLTEEMIAQVSRMDPERLGVIARTSAMQYKETTKNVTQIGRELGVDYILESSFRREGNRVRVTAQLVRVSDQTHLWSQDYERDVSEILPLESEVTQAIAHEIEIRLSAREKARRGSAQSVDPEAHQLYLKGRYFWNKRTEDGYIKAVQLFQQAIAKQPDYAEAYTGLSDAYDLLGSVPNAELPRSEAMSRARAAALKALEIDDTLAEAHASLAGVSMIYDWNWPLAEREFKRAIELNPGYATAHHWYAYYFDSQKQTEEALREIRLAQQLDPLSLIINTDMVEMLYYSRQYNEAIEQARKTLELDPNFAPAHYWLGLAYLAKQEYRESIAELETAVRLSGGQPDIKSCLRIAYAQVGRRDEARKILEQVRTAPSARYDLPLQTAWIFEALGERDQALALAEKLYPKRPTAFYLLKVSPLADPLRSDPRFQQLVRRGGLPP